MDGMYQPNLLQSPLPSNPLLTYVYFVKNDTESLLWVTTFKSEADARMAVESRGDPQHAYSIYKSTCCNATMKPTKFNWTNR